MSSTEASYPTRRSLRLAREVGPPSADGSDAGDPAPQALAVPSAAVDAPLRTRRAMREAMADHGSATPPAAGPADAPVAPYPLEPVEPQHPSDVVVTIDAAIDTAGEGLAPVPDGARLDWLAATVTASKRDGTAAATPVPAAAAWFTSLRGTVAGVDLRSPAMRRRLPQLGVVAVMAAASMGNAYAGHFSTPASSIGGAATEFARAQVAILPGAEGATPVTSDLDNSGDLVAGEDGVLRVRAAEDASRGGSRDPLPDCDGVPPEVATSNGNVSEEYLCVLPNSSDKLRADAAEAFALMNEAYAANFGTPICVTSGYRSYAQQAALRRQKPGLAAPAGSSQHGNGLAVDLCGGVQDEGAGYWWLRENGPAFGFDNPPWARRGGSKYEPWHWEYVAGQW